MGAGAEAGFTIAFAVIGFLATAEWLRRHLLVPAWKDLCRRHPRVAYRLLYSLVSLYGLLAVAMLGAAVAGVIYTLFGRA